MMATNAKANKLSIVSPRDAVTETWAQQGYQNSNGQYEALWDATAPGASSQTFCGHDHTPNGGGGPIHRGALWSACALSALVQLQHSAKDQALELVASSASVDTMQIHASPGLPVGSLLTGWICYYARNSDKFTLQMSDTTTVYDLELPISDGEKLNWFRFAIPVAYPGQWKQRNIFVKCGSYDASNGPAFDLYAIQIDELPDVLPRVGVPVREDGGATGQTAVVSFGTLDDDLVAADEWLDAYALRELYGFGNGLFEGIEEIRAPRSSAQVCRGHDHDASNYGGRAIARGGCYTGSLQGATYLYRIAWNGTSYSGYYAWDLDDGPDRRSAASVGMANFWVSPGLSSSGSPPTTAPYLTARLWVEWDAGMATPTMNFRGVNIGLSQNSAVTTITSTSSYANWVTIDKIPCDDDAINKIQFEIEMTGTTTTVNVDLVAFAVYEVPGVGGRTNTTLAPLAGGAS